MMIGKRKHHTKLGLHHLHPCSQPPSYAVIETENATPGYNCALTAGAEHQSTNEELDLVHFETDDNVVGIC